MAEKTPLTQEQLRELADLFHSIYTQWDESKVATAFRLFDRDGNGTISTTELKTVLAQENGVEFAESIANEIIQEADTNRDGVIQLSEFFEMVRKSANPRVE